MKAMKAGIILNWDTKEAIVFDNSVDVELEYWFEQEVFGAEAIDKLYFEDLLEFQAKISDLEDQKWRLFFRSS